jgi:carboxyl-terminal processing protease
MLSMVDHFLVENSSKTKINKLIDFIDNEYVDNINTDSIVNITVDNILSHLDPHSVYISQVNKPKWLRV